MIEKVVAALIGTGGLVENSMVIHRGHQLVCRTKSMMETSDIDAYKTAELMADMIKERVSVENATRRGIPIDTTINNLAKQSQSSEPNVYTDSDGSVWIEVIIPTNPINIDDRVAHGFDVHPIEGMSLEIVNGKVTPVSINIHNMFTYEDNGLWVIIADGSEWGRVRCDLFNLEQLSELMNWHLSGIKIGKNPKESQMIRWESLGMKIG